jgi:hypothetical protein
LNPKLDTELNPAGGPLAEGQSKFTSIGRYYGKPEEVAASFGSAL